MKLAVQLYSLRDCIKSGDDFLHILEEVKRIGFDGVEFAGYFGLDANIIKKKLDELGLVAVGTHLGLPDYEDENLDATIEFCKTLGCLYMGVGGASHDTVEDCEYVGKVLGNAAAKSGITTYYHNHTEEFTPLANGKTAMEIIGEKTNLEIDTYWSFYAGVDNYKFITENRDKIVLIHMKDGIDGNPKALTEGNCDLDAVVKAVKDTEIEWVILENDDPVPNGIDDVTRSMKYLKTIK